MKTITPKLTILLLVFFSTSIFSQTTIVDSGAVWTYLYTSATPPNDAQGDTWKQLNFNDSAWGSGPSSLGNDHIPATTITVDGDGKVRQTTYFRHVFNVADASVFDFINLEAVRDDGIVVYLNDAEIWRSNMPAGTIVHATEAASTVSGGDETTWFTISNLTNLVLTGNNILAVEVHQRGTNSSDINFNFKLIGDVTGPPPVDQIVAGEVWNYYDNSQQPPNDSQGDTWITSNFDDTSWASGAAELGYGDTQVTTINSATEVGYFRKKFNVADASIYNSIDLEAIRDDGMVAYINGTEVWRDNMPSGAVNYSTFASATASDDGTVWQTISIQNLLVTGLNTVAIEIHQRSATSSDISFNFKLTPSTAVVSPVIRGPYLQTGTSTSVIVRWRTSYATDTKVNYGTSLGALNSSVFDPTLTTEHEIEINGLTANTKYYYELEDAGGVYEPEDAGMFIQTAPAIGTKQFVRAWFLGDAGTANTDQMNVRDAYYNYVANATNPNQTDMMVFLGDNAYNNGTDSEYQNALFDIYDTQLRKTITWSTLGNHDGYSVNFNTQSGPYYSIFTFPIAAEAGGVASGTEEYYSYDYANVHFIVLQSNNVDGGGAEPAFNTNQKNWLTADLAATTQDWIVAVFHHPPYTKGSHNSDNDGENGLKTMREQYLPILEAGGVDLTLSGHSHSYERSRFVKGHTGYSNTFNSNLTTSGGHIVGANGNLSGRTDNLDGAYEKTASDGTVYITAGSSGKATGASFSGDPYNPIGGLPVMYYSAQSLGSIVLEVSDDQTDGQNMNVIFLRDTGIQDDYFTIHKPSVVLSVNTDDIDSNDVNVYPVPSNSFLNIKLEKGEQLKYVKFYNTIGTMVKQSDKEQINVNGLNTGVYMIQIKSDKNTYYKSVIIE